MNDFLNNLSRKRKRVFAVFFALFLFCAIVLTLTGTLSYPLIMAERQIQTLRDCTFGSPEFKTEYYGFSFKVPTGLCSLPNRLFPRDGSVEIVPKAAYFVFNEYAKGTIAESSRASVLIEPITPNRDPTIILQTLIRGKFLNESDLHFATTSSGILVRYADNVLGTDEKSYNWALVSKPDNKYFMAIITKKQNGVAERDVIVESLRMF